MNLYILIASILINIILLFPMLVKADPTEMEQEYYDGMGSSGWDYADDADDDDESEQRPEVKVKKHIKVDLSNSPNEFFSVDDTSVVDEQVSRSDLEDKIKKHVKK